MRDELLSLCKCLFCIACLLATPQELNAKSLSKMIEDLGIPGADLSLMENVARDLYTNRPPRAGRSATWSNPDTGSLGKVTIREWDGRCAQLLHVVQVEAKPDPISLRTWRCRSSSGKWLLQLQPPPRAHRHRGDAT